MHTYYILVFHVFFCSSPKQYALQRTQAVMATVRAATQAMARRQERLAGQMNPPSDQTQSNGQLIKPPTISTPRHPFNPIATSSPEGPSVGLSIGVGTSGLNSSHLAPHPLPLSPTVSEAGSTLSLPDEASWLRHQHYVAPEKLQIVKPLEGSVTLLKWKLMASPQLGGATSFFSDASRPGVHVKGWKAAGIVDKENQERNENSGGSLGLPQELRLKSLSTSDLAHFATSPTSPPSSHPHTPSSSSHRIRRGLRSSRDKGIHSRTSKLTASTSAAADGNGMNTLSDIAGSFDRGDEVPSHDQRKNSHDRRRSSVKEEDLKKETKEEGNTSLFQQVGNLFSWSGLGLGGSRGSRDSRGDNQRDSIDDTVDSPGGGADMGLAGIL